MEIKYFTDDLSISAIGNLIGLNVDELTVGAIETGEYVDDTDPLGNPIKRAVKKRGIQIKFAQEPTPEQLGNLDIVLSPYRRDGGKSLSDRFKELEIRVNSLETKGSE